MNFIYYLASFIAVLFVFCPHEFAHAWVAYKNGDATPKIYGRVTLNPLKHVDPMGFIMWGLVGFGWAKPVPINPYNFKNYRLGMFLTAISGVVVNLIIAFLVCPLCLILAGNNFNNLFLEFITLLFYSIFRYSIYSFIFNLLPLFPLDGFRVVEAFTREINPVHKFLKNYGQCILIILLVESFCCNLLFNFGVTWAIHFNILNYLSIVADWIAYPMELFWNLIV